MPEIELSASRKAPQRLLFIAHEVQYTWTPFGSVRANLRHLDPEMAAKRNNCLSEEMLSHSTCRKA